MGRPISPTPGIIALSAGLLLAPAAWAQSGGAYRLAWTSLDGGSAPVVSGGNYALRDGTTGIATAGSIAGGPYSMQVGPIHPAPAGTSAAPLAPEIPARFQLFAPRPNPFRGATEIVFDLPVETHARVEVYTLAGERMRTLLDDLRPAGRHHVLWDGVDGQGHPVPNGIFFIRVEAGGSSAVTKIARVE